MSASGNAAVRSGFGATERSDAWWVKPLAVGIGLAIAGGYLFWGAFQNAHYEWGPYLSPLYSPLIFGHSGHAWFGETAPWWPSFLPYSPAFLILWAPGLFRLSCYYYRKAYYRSYFMDPPACAVGEFRGKRYKGETAFPFFLQNLHRYTMYLALVFVVILTYDAIVAFFFEDGFGVGIGTIVLWVNAILIGSYTLGCHSFRHLIGGRQDCYSCGLSGALQHGAWKRASWLNARHQLFAWLSLGWVCFTDLYVRMVSMGVWTDWRIF